MSSLLKLSENRKTILLASITLLALASVIFLYTQLLGRGAKATWWDGNWLYRKALDITNNNTGDLTDFQVSFTLDTASLISTGKLQNDCDDIRITDSNGTLLDHWIAENSPGCNSSATRIWVKVPTVTQGTDATTLYLYYGNSAANNIENGESVFIFFDDFNSDTLDTDKWWNNGEYEISNGVIRSWSDTSGYKGIGIQTSAYQSSPTDLHSLEYLWKTSGQGTMHHIYNHNDGIENRFGIHPYYSGRSGPRMTYRINNGSYIDGSSYTSISTNTWYIGQVQRRSAGGFYTATRNSNYSLRCSDSHSSSYWETITFPWTMIQNTNVNYYYDWFYVRKYASSEPSVTVSSENTKFPDDSDIPPIGYWKLDEGSGSVAYDFSSNENDGTINGATWQTSESCVNGNCLSLDGTDDYISTPLNWTPTSFTVQWWLYPETCTDYNQQLRGVNLWGSFVFHTTNDCSVYVGTDSSTRFSPTELPSNTLTKNTWQLLTYTYDGSQGRFYKNGVLLTGPKTQTPSSAWGGFEIGYNSTNTIDGFVDTVKVYSYARTQEQIESDYDAGLALGDSRAAFGTSTNNKTPFLLPEKIDKPFTFESGTVSLSDTINETSPTTVTLTHDYIEPVIVAFMTTRSGAESVDVRVRNVSRESFDIFMQEPDNETHAAESVSYIVVESGRWELSEDLIIEAGVHKTNNVHNSGESYDGDSIELSGEFPSAPVILATLNTHNNENFMSTVVHNTSSTGFQLQQEAAQSSRPVITERIGWIAMSPGSGTLNGYNYEAVIKGLTGTDNGVTNTPTTITYSSSFSSTPDVVVNGYTGNDNDGYWARGAGTSNSTTLTVYAEEDQVGDTERSHSEEGFSYIAFESDANWQTSTYSYTASVKREIFSTGKVTLSNTIDNTSATRINFLYEYTNPVVVAFIKTRAGDESVDVRVKNVTSSGFDIFMEEPDNETHVAEIVSYMVVESGRWQLSDNLVIEAGIHTTDNVHNSGGAYNGDNISFSSEFTSTPVVLATLNTYNNAAFMSSIVHNTSSSGFQLQQEAAQTPITATTEDIGWVAISTGSGSFNGFDFESIINPLTGIDNGVSNTPTTITYSSSFDVAPVIIVNGYTGNDYDGYWTRGAGTYNSSTLTVYAEEDQRGDSERSHTEEGLSYIAFEPGAYYTLTPGNNTWGQPQPNYYTIPGDSTSSDPPIAEWLIDENQGTTLYDSSTNSNNGTMINMDNSNWDIGKLDTGIAVELNGVDEYIDLGYGQGINPSTSPHSFSLWVKKDPSTSQSIFLSSSQEPNAGNRFYLCINASGNWDMGVHNSLWGSGTIPADNNWNHITVTMDGSVAKMYVNGKITRTITYGSYTFNRDLYIGVHDSNYWFKGFVDEVRIYDYARTQSQILWDYNRGKPLAYWKLDECIGNTVNDASGNGYNGTITIGGSGTQTSAGTCTSGNSTEAWANGIEGHLNSSLSFDGIDDRITISHNTNLNIPARGSTFSYWAYCVPGASSTSNYTINKYNNGSWNGYSLNLSADECAPYFYYGINSSNYTSTDSLTALGSLIGNKWSFIVYTLDSSGTLRLYIDGVLQHTQPWSNGTPTNTNTTYDLWLGYRNTNANAHFKGLMDEIRLYNYDLTQEQIKILHNNDSAVRF
jgi:hypothetical protein